MKTKKHNLFKKIRSKAGMSVTRAANFALVDPRTWRCWETEEDNETARSPKAAALWSFFARSGLPEPVTQMEHSPRGQVLSIASAKGGVGKTPITINVAASMVEKGFKVAIVTHDLVYRFAHDDGQQPVPGTLVSKIDFYDELDLITFTDAVKHRRNDTRQHLASLPPHEQELYRAHHAVELRALERKQHATEKLSELIKGAPSSQRIQCCHAKTGPQAVRSNETWTLSSRRRRTALRAKSRALNHAGIAVTARFCIQSHDRFLAHVSELHHARHGYSVCRTRQICSCPEGSDSPANRANRDTDCPHHLTGHGEGQPFAQDGFCNGVCDDGREFVGGESTRFRSADRGNGSSGPCG